MAAVDHEEKAVTSRKYFQIERYAGAGVFVAFIGAHLMFGAKTAIKVSGVACVVTGLLWILRRAVPVGIEGRPPSFHLGGWAAVIAGIAIAVVGVGLIAYSGLAVCLLGREHADEC